MLAGAPEQVSPSRELDELGHPVPRCHQRIDPLQCRDAGTFGHARALLGQRLDPSPQPGRELLPLALQVQRPADTLDVGPDVFESQGLERDEPGREAGPVLERLLQVSRGNRTDLTERLRQDHLRSELAKSLGVHVVDRKALRDQGLHVPVDLEAGCPCVDARRGE